MKDVYLLEVRKLCKSYHQKEVVSQMQFGVHDGEILGFLGPNGAGKSTTIRLILGMEDANEGSILFCNQVIQPGNRDFLKSVGYVPQEISVYSDLSAFENVRFFCSLYGYHGEELRSRTRQALEFVKLWEHGKEKPESFSGGMKRRLNIACAIAHSPRLLIMDEPTCSIVFFLCSIFVYLIFALLCHISLKTILPMTFFYFSLCICVGSIGSLVGLGMKNFLLIKNVISIPFTILAFFGGTFYPFRSSSSLISGMIQWSPFTFMNRSCFLLLYDDNPLPIVNCSIGMLAISAVITLITYVCFQKEEYIHGTMPSYEK